jgi:heme O synthase-like polyprenyltransferase
MTEGATSLPRMLSTVLAAASSEDLQILWIILALIAFGVGIWLTTLGNYVGAIIAALIGVVIIVVAVY